MIKGDLDDNLWPASPENEAPYTGFLCDGRDLGHGFCSEGGGTKAAFLGSIGGLVYVEVIVVNELFGALRCAGFYWFLKQHCFVLVYDVCWAALTILGSLLTCLGGTRKCWRTTSPTGWPSWGSKMSRCRPKSMACLGASLLEAVDPAKNAIQLLRCAHGA